MSEGALVERGTHAELMSLDGAYAKMWAQQQSGRTATAPRR